MAATTTGFSRPRSPATSEPGRRAGSTTRRGRPAGRRPRFRGWSRGRGARQRARLGGRDLEHAPAGRHRSVAQRQRHQAAGRTSGATRAMARSRWACVEMHPDRRQHDEVVAFAQRMDAVEIGQRIVDPGDRRVARAGAGPRPRSSGVGSTAVTVWPQLGEGRGVAARAGADIDDPARRRWEEMQDARDGRRRRQGSRIA